MKPITKFHIKTFLWTGVPYGLLMAAFDWAVGNEFLLWKLLFQIFLFGLFMSLYLVGIQKRRLKKMGITEFTDDTLARKQTRIFKTDLNLTQLIEKLKTNEKIAGMEMSEIENGILLKNGMSFYSWGEEIRIILKSENDSEFEYQVSSTPSFKLTMVDYGKNLGNIKLIENVANSIA